MKSIEYYKLHRIFVQQPNWYNVDKIDSAWEASMVTFLSNSSLTVPYPITFEYPESDSTVWKLILW